MCFMWFFFFNDGGGLCGCGSCCGGFGGFGGVGWGSLGYGVELMKWGLEFNLIKVDKIISYDLNIENV